MKVSNLETIKALLETELDRMQDNHLPTCPESMDYIGKLGAALDEVRAVIYDLTS